MVYLLPDNAAVDQDVLKTLFSETSLQSRLGQTGVLLLRDSRLLLTHSSEGCEIVSYNRTITLPSLPFSLPMFSKCPSFSSILFSSSLLPTFSFSIYFPLRSPPSCLSPSLSPSISPSLLSSLPPIATLSTYC